MILRPSTLDTCNFKSIESKFDFRSVNCVLSNNAPIIQRFMSLFNRSDICEKIYIKTCSSAKVPQLLSYSSTISCKGAGIQSHMTDVEWLNLSRHCRMSLFGWKTSRSFMDVESYSESCSSWVNWCTRVTNCFSVYERIILVLFINTKITFEWAPKQIVTTVHVLFHFLLDITDWWMTIQRRPLLIVPVSHSLGFRPADDVKIDGWWRHKDHTMVTRPRE